MITSIEISVILPVYNREKFLNRTLESLENQVFKNFELIIIDDGSQDSSCEIAQEFCKKNKNKNWKLFKLEHQGVSYARSFGIKNSIGKYISFVDSDDSVEPDFLRILYENIKNCQISICNYKKKIGDSKISKNIFFHKSGIFSRNQILKSLISDISLKSFLWNKLFERSLFDDIIMPQMCFEDKIICLQVFSKIKKCSVTRKKLYNYYINETSLTWQMNEQILSDYIKYSEFLKEFFCKKEYKIFSFRHKLFCMHIFTFAFKVFFAKYKKKEINIGMFFKFFFENCKRILYSMKI
ncbi:MAG: glycosyltransferase family 2 protein [Clostridia bacterium]|nr:glycosyltransferase family 2 protein [Clostridia bacterium]